MRFYLIESTQGETMGCQLTKRAAHEYMASMGYAKTEYSVEWVDVDVTAENVRRLLGNHGGYATRLQGSAE